MQTNEITGLIIDTSLRIHKQLGPGLFESIYESILHYELGKMGLIVQKQVTVPVFWNELKLDHGFKADLIVENSVLVEVKSVALIADVHKKQVLTYLKLTGIQVGLLINFNESLFKHGLTRIVHGFY